VENQGVGNVSLRLINIVQFVPIRANLSPFFVANIQNSKPLTDGLEWVTIKCKWMNVDNSGEKWVIP
jgi:hypothetical protein